jgi:hypothetical protein
MSLIGRELFASAEASKGFRLGTSGGGGAGSEARLVAWLAYAWWSPRVEIPSPATSVLRFHLDAEAQSAEQSFDFNQGVLSWVAVAFTQVMHGQTKAADLDGDQCILKSRFIGNQIPSVTSLDRSNPLNCLRPSFSFVAETSVHTRLFFVSKRCASQSIPHMLQGAQNGGARGSRVPNQDQCSAVLG